MKDNLAEITAPKPETQDQRDRRADLTLLYACIDLSKSDLYSFLDELGVGHNEYKRLVKKYSRVLDSYKKEQLDDRAKH